MPNITRMLGGADELALAEVRAAVARHMPDAANDVESMIVLERLEFSYGFHRLAQILAFETLEAIKIRVICGCFGLRCVTPVGETLCSIHKTGLGWGTLFDKIAG